MKQRIFGSNKKGQTAALYTFENKNGMVMEVTDFGATLVSLLIPRADGDPVDVVLGYDNPTGYEGPSGTFFGATVGRNANRIAGGSFAINGRTYQLDKNNGNNNLHSGLDFQSFRIWNVKAVTDNSITFLLHSPDGDQGYPGNVDLEVTYTLTEDNGVRLDYLAVPDADTILNLTNHSYFNLNGHAAGSIAKHTVWLDADFYTPANAQSIPTGEIASVADTPMDFRTKKEVGRDIDMDFEALVFGHGYDHNWCLNNGRKLAKVARLEADQTSIVMEVYTDLPGVQIYTANFVDREPGKNGVVYQRRQGICFETQYYPDTPNHPNFPSSLCKAGQTYKTTTIYQFLLSENSDTVL